MSEPNYQRELLARAAAWPEAAELGDLTPRELQRIAAVEGIDFATALLYDRLVRSPRHGPFIEQLAALAPATPRLRWPGTLAIAPGGFYKEKPQSGAHGRVLRDVAARLGCRSAVVPLESFGSLANNARILCDWLAARPEEPLILASLSKAGAEVKLALARSDAARVFRNVRWWLNFSGVVDGTALSEWLLARRLRTLGCRLFCWLRGYHFGAIAELASRPGAPLDFALRLPPHLRAIHVVGFPLSHQLTPGPMQRGFRRLRHLGPTDGGGILLAGVSRLPGLVYPMWGADHYLRPQGQDGHEIVARLLQYVCQQEQPIAGGDESCKKTTPKYAQEVSLSTTAIISTTTSGLSPQGI